MASCVKKVAIEMAPHLSMVVIQLSTAGYVVLSQAILIQGTSSIILAFYSFLSATIYMGILVVIFERKKKPPLNGSILVWTVILSFVGVSLTQNMLIACLYFIPATTETAISNMVPILTYALSVVLRQERLQLNTWCGRGKLLGTLTLAFGALVLIFWTNGPALLKLPLTITMGASRFGYWILGIAMAFIASLSTSIWIIYMRPLTRLYPAEATLNVSMMFLGTLLQVVVAAIIYHKPSQWRLGWNLELLFIFYSGGSVAISNILMTWCSFKKGPIFVASFMPLSLVFATILQIMFLHNPVHVGSVAGSVLILIGLYIFLWSMYKEEKTYSNTVDGCNSIDSPLLS